MNHDVCDRNLLIGEPVVKGWQIRCHRFGHIAVLHRNLGAEHVPRDRGPNINAAELLALHPYAKFGVTHALDSSPRLR